MGTKDELMCGLHSDIPLCCIMFYETWLNIRKFIPEISSIEVSWCETHQCYDAHNWLSKSGVEYIACPDCVERLMSGKTHPNKTKDCDCSWSRNNCEKLANQIHG